MNKDKYIQIRVDEKTIKNLKYVMKEEFYENMSLAIRYLINNKAYEIKRDKKKEKESILK